MVVLLPPNDFARSMASFEASSEYSEMSKGTRIFLTILLLLQLLSLSLSLSVEQNPIRPTNI
jgi:hypothetical protein